MHPLLDAGAVAIAVACSLAVVFASLAPVASRRLGERLLRCWPWRRAALPPSPRQLRCAGCAGCAAAAAGCGSAPSKR
jgi:hypothetical protein